MSLKFRQHKSKVDFKLQCMFSPRGTAMEIIEKIIKGSKCYTREQSLHAIGAVKEEQRNKNKKDVRHRKTKVKRQISRCENDNPPQIDL